MLLWDGGTSGKVIGKIGQSNAWEKAQIDLNLPWY
jgi:hypothetical protein